jgi:hypothetical protein
MTWFSLASTADRLGHGLGNERRLGTAYVWAALTATDRSSMGLLRRTQAAPIPDAGMVGDVDQQKATLVGSYITLID